jgi:hypothetical protein
MITDLYRQWLLVFMIILVSLANNPVFMCIMATPEALESTNQIGGIGDFTNLRCIRLSKIF